MSNIGLRFLVWVCCISTILCSCIENSYEDNGVCKSCPANSVSNAGTVTVTECMCMPGFERSDTLCVSCKTGFFKNTTSNDMCTQCETGRVSLQGSTSDLSCVYCTSGKYLDNNLNGLLCTTCPGQTMAPVGGTGINTCECRPGFTGLGLLVPALVRYDFNSQRPVSKWLEYAEFSGAYTDITNNIDIYGVRGGTGIISWVLPPNFNQFRVSFRHGYATGGYVNMVLDDIVLASSHNYQTTVKRMPYTPGSILKIHAIGPHTSIGYALSLEFYKDACVACPLGSYKDTISSKTCTHCQSGYIGANATQHTKFQTYINSTGLDPLVRSSRNYCQPCPPGTVTILAASDVCSPCPPGTYSVGVEQSSINECTKCRKGTYSAVEAAESSSTCTACESGKFHRSLGVTSADACKECLCRK
jgi:hypothetical protein